MLAQESQWTILDPIEARSANGADLIKQDDLSLVSSGPCPDKDVYTITAQVRLRDGHVAANGSNGGPEPAAWRAGAAGKRQHASYRVGGDGCPERRSSATRELTLTNPQADFNQMPGWTIDGRDRSRARNGMGHYPEVGRTHTAVFELAEPIRAD